MADLRSDQHDLLSALVETYVRRVPTEATRRKLGQVRHHIDDTWFTWHGRHVDTGAFYYRVHSSRCTRVWPPTSKRVRSTDDSHDPRSSAPRRAAQSASG